MVIKAPHVGSRDTSSPSIIILGDFPFTPSQTALNYTEHTDSTSGTSLLNSSKHPQVPEEAKPLKIDPNVS